MEQYGTYGAFRTKLAQLYQHTSPLTVGPGEVFPAGDAQPLATELVPPMLEQELHATGAQVWAATCHGASSPPWLEVQPSTSS